MEAASHSSLCDCPRTPMAPIEARRGSRPAGSQRATTIAQRRLQAVAATPCANRHHAARRIQPRATVRCALATPMHASFPTAPTLSSRTTSDRRLGSAVWYFAARGPRQPASKTRPFASRVPHSTIAQRHQRGPHDAKEQRQTRMPPPRIRATLIRQPMRQRQGWPHVSCASPHARRRRRHAQQMATHAWATPNLLRK